MQKKRNMPGGKLTKKEGVLIERNKKRKAFLKKSSHKSYRLPENFYPPAVDKETDNNKEE